jgi:hypothetical protein
MGSQSPLIVVEHPKPEEPQVCALFLAQRLDRIDARRLERWNVGGDKSDRQHDKDAPISRPAAPPTAGEIVVIPHLAGLHHRYERRAA